MPAAHSPRVGLSLFLLEVPTSAGSADFSLGDYGKNTERCDKCGSGSVRRRVSRPHLGSPLRSELFRPVFIPGNVMRVPAAAADRGEPCAAFKARYRARRTSGCMGLGPSGLQLTDLIASGILASVR